MKRLQTISISIAVLLLMVCACLICNNIQLRNENINLTKGIGERDSIIKIQKEYIIQLTYQHEDDERLMQE